MGKMLLLLHAVCRSDYLLPITCAVICNHSAFLVLSGENESGKQF